MDLFSRQTGSLGPRPRGCRLRIDSDPFEGLADPMGVARPARPVLPFFPAVQTTNAHATLPVCYRDREEIRKTGGIDLPQEAAERGLWDLAARVVREHKNDLAWIGSWLDRRGRLSVLDELGDDIG